MVLNLIMMLTIGLGKISAQINLTDLEVRKINATYAKLDSAQAQGRIVLSDLKAYQDSTKAFKDSATYWKGQAFKFKRKRNNWRLIAIGEAAYIALTSRKKLLP